MKDTLSLFQELSTYLLQQEKENPVAKPIPAKELYEAINLALPELGMNADDFKQVLKKVIATTPKTSSNAFFNQLFGGRNEHAILGELLSVLLNNSMYTYKAAGPMIGIEKVIIRRICDLLSWNEDSDGTFAPGGSMTNFMSMLMARDAKLKDVQQKGIHQKPRVYTSKESHYSIPKNAAFSGIGRENVIYIKTNQYGEMDVNHLQACIESDVKEGYTPVLINATAGTTVLGAFDNVEEISKIANQYNVWLHVDGAYCGSVIFSQQYKHLLNGLEKVDSFSVNAHKMLSTPLSCSMIVVKNKEHLYHSFSNDADYLYQTHYDEFNPGKISLQCGRRNDALKFWTLWKNVGSKGLEDIVNHQFALADVAREYIRSNNDYTLYSYDNSVSICFNYKDIPAEKICTALYEEAELMVGYGQFQGQEFIRLVTVNAQNSKEEILSFFKKLEEFVENNMIV